MERIDVFAQLDWRALRDIVITASDDVAETALQTILELTYQADYDGTIRTFDFEIKRAEDETADDDNLMF